jgi:predicted porin
MQLRYRLIVAAVGAACGLAQAQSTVEIYGTVVPFFDSAKTSGATSPAPAAADRPNQLTAAAYTGVNDPVRNRLTVGTSNWGFRGTEVINPNLKVVWQLESGFQTDQNVGPGIGARDNKVGLAGPWGEVFLGQWDTPYKYISLPVNPFRAGMVFDRSGITGNPGQGVGNTTTQFTRVNAKPDASFDRRQGNSVQYWSPRWGGFSFRADYSVNEGKTVAVAGGPVISPTLAGVSLQYDNGGLSVRYAYEQHDDYFGMAQLGGSAGATVANPTSKDLANKLVVVWRIANTRIAALAEQLKYKTDDSLVGAVNEYKRNAYYIVVEQFFANKSSLWAAYGRAEDGSCGRVGGAACSTRALGADNFAIGYIYRLSNRTWVYTTYYRMNNKENGQYSPGPTVSTLAVAPGADTTAFGVGIYHYF